MPSKSCANLEVRLPDNSSIKSAQVCSTHNSQRVQQAGKASLSNRLRFRNAQKRGYLSTQGLHNSRFLHQIVSCTKTREKMAPCDRSKCPEQFSACSYVQNGDCRDYQKLGHKRGMASFHRSEGCVLSRSHTSGFSSLASIPCRQTNVPIQSSAFLVSQFTRIVKEVKLVLQSRGIRVHHYLDDWLLRANTRHQCQLQTKELIHVVQELSFVINFGISELEPTQKNRLSGLPFRFDTGKSISNRKEVENSRKGCSGHGDRITNNPKVAYVPDRCTSIPRKDNTNGLVTYAPFPVVPKNKLAVSPVTRPEDSCFKPSEKASSVVERSQKSRNGLSFTSTGTQYPYFHRCVKSGLGSSFGQHDCQWQLDRSRKITSYQCPRVKGSVSGLKKLSKQNSRQKGSDSNRQRHCSQLSEQTRGNTLLGQVSPGLAHPGLLQSAKHTPRARHIQGCLNVIADSLSRKDKVIQTEWSLHPQIFTLICKVWHKPMVDMLATKLNHKLPIYV